MELLLNRERKEEEEAKSLEGPHALGLDPEFQEKISDGTETTPKELKSQRILNGMPDTELAETDGNKARSDTLYYAPGIKWKGESPAVNRSINNSSSFVTDCGDPFL